MSVFQSYRRFVALLIGGILLPLGPVLALAHDVPDRFFDRAVQLQIAPQRIHVTYQLSISHLTLAQELLALVGAGGVVDASPGDRFRQFEQGLGPLLARGLLLDVDGRSLDFQFLAASHVQEEHVRFRFELVAAGSFEPGRVHQLKLEDTNFFMEKGRLQMGVSAAEPCVLEAGQAVTEPVPTTAAWEMTPEQQDAARRLQAQWVLPAPGGDESAPGAVPVGDDPHQLAARTQPGEPAAEQSDQAGAERHLTQLLDRWSEGFYGMMLILAFLFGAAHAMTPGHGKTMVAAYLVGERGTLRHAVGLGLTTSLTHTSSVLGVALLLWLIDPAVQDRIHSGFSLLSGLLVAGLGGYLLLVRLGAWRHCGNAEPQAGQTCHAGCAHDAAPARSERPGWAGLITLGISGGIVPCWDAVVLLLIATAQGQIDRAIYLLLSFSAGLACTLVMVGVMAVQLRGFLSSRIRGGGVVQSLPVVSAAAILAVGVYLCVLTLQHPGNPGALSIPTTHRVAGP